MKKKPRGKSRHYPNQQAIYKSMDRQVRLGEFVTRASEAIEWAREQIE